MAVDHCAFFTRVSVVAETYLGRRTVLPTAPWIVVGLVTNISAPIFWFLGGVSVALLAASDRRRTGSVLPTVHYLCTRALLLMLLDVVVMPTMWADWHALHQHYTFDLFSSIGLSLVLAAALLPLPAWSIAAIAAVLAIAYPVVFEPRQEALVGAPLAMRLWAGYNMTVLPRVTFPVLGWFPLLAGGLAAGKGMASGAWQRSRPWAIAGAALLGAWAIARATGIGDFPAQPPLAGWRNVLVMSKGPPGFDYLAFNLGLGLLVTALLWRPGVRFDRPPVRWLVILGQASLFFFVAHLLVFRVLSLALHHVIRNADVVRYVIVLVVGMALMVPATRAYRRLKERHRGTVLRYF